MIGDYQWVQKTQGRLTFKEKFRLIQSILMPVTVSFIRSGITSRKHCSAPQISDIVIPDSNIVKEAFRELEYAQNPSVTAHSLRTYFMGTAIAHQKKWQFDQEDFAVASFMHDLGLVSELSLHACHCFTLESAKQAEILCQKHNYSEQKIQNICDAICLHMNGHLDENDETLSKEILMLQKATACDVTGANLHLIPAAFTDQLLDRYPRDHFLSDFKTLIQQESTRHPHSRTALLNKAGLGLMIQLNPLNRHSPNTEQVES